MMTTKRTPLPFLTTHLANVALNKQIGLVFLMQDAQETCGLTSVSEESLVSDQLNVGAWMINFFMHHKVAVGNISDTATPWMEFEPFDISRGVQSLMNFDREEMKGCMEMVKQIDAERAKIDDQLWNPEHEDAQGFLKKIVAQIHECVAYAAKRVEAIKLCAEMDPDDPAAMVESLVSRGPEMGMDLLAGFGGLLGGAGIGPLGYLTIKNAIAPPITFSRRFLDVVRCVVETKAVQEGYTKPLAT